MATVAYAPIDIDQDLSAEAWREYDFGGRIYLIENPLRLMTRRGGTTHRIITSGGLVHCCPAPGFNGCVLRWQSKDADKPVQF